MATHLRASIISLLLLLLNAPVVAVPAAAPSLVPVALALTTIHAPAHCAERSTNRICIPSAIRIVVALDGGIKAQRTFAVMPFVEKCVHAHTSMDVMTVIPWRRCGCAEVEIWIAGGAM